MSKNDEFAQGTGKPVHKIIWENHGYGIGAGCSCGEFSVWDGQVRPRGGRTSARASINRKFKDHKAGN